MNTVAHKRAAPRLPGVARPTILVPKREPNMTPLTLSFIGLAAFTAASGFYVNALWVFTGFFCLMSVVSHLSRKYPGTSPLETTTPYQRELMPGTFDFRRRQERWWG